MHDIALVNLEDLSDQPHVIIDVRSAEEIAVDPVPSAQHIELHSVPQHLEKLPQDKVWAFVCAGNIRSQQAAEYCYMRGFENVCVLDKFSL